MLRVIVAGFITLCSCSFLLVSDFALSGPSQRRFVLVGTGSITGVYHSIGGGLCRFIVASSNAIRENQHTPSQRLICSTSATAGSIYNLNSIRRGVMDVGIAQSDIGYYAYAGQNLYGGIAPMEHLRLLASLHKEYLTIVVRKDSNIKVIDDIKGKRINIGAPGTGVRSAMISLLKAKGWSSADFLVTSDLKSSEQVQYLCDGKIDVITDFIGHPNAAMQEAVATCDAVAISLDDALISQLVEKYPYYSAALIPAGTYVNNASDVNTISVKASIFATTALSDEMAYVIVKSIASNLDRFHALSGALKNITVQDMPGQIDNELAVPMHNGAIRFYKEIGLLE